VHIRNITFLRELLEQESIRYLQTSHWKNNLVYSLIPRVFHLIYRYIIINDPDKNILFAGKLNLDDCHEVRDRKNPADQTIHTHMGFILY